MEQSVDWLKDFANRAAQLASSEDTNKALRMLKLAGLLSLPRRLVDTPTSESTSAKGTATDAQSGVGIWSRREKDGKTCFVRRMDLRGEWYLWANVGRIEPKSSKPRVVLIGESVARGYIYDPLFNPAMALRGIFDSHLGEGQVEVVDLARTNLGEEVCDLAKSVIQLEPDLVIIFAGNNWRSFLALEEFGPAIEPVLRTHGIAGLKKLADEQRAEIVRRHATDIASFYQAQGIPLLWIIPEFNLGDWRDPISNAPHLPADGNRNWLFCFDAAQSALEDGNFECAAQMAQQMTDLDHGTNPAGLYILAECSRRRGDLLSTRRFLERARDSELWLPGWTVSPRTAAQSRAIMIEAARKHGNYLVDSSQVLRDFLDGEIPDRRLFVDYCHLSDEGIRVTMAAAASHVLAILKDIHLPWRALLSDKAAPSPEVRAEAAFLAALHNAHWWQSYDVVSHYCLKAVQTSPHVVPIMIQYLEVQTRCAPMLMCKAAEELYEMGSPLINHYLLHFNGQLLDRLLLDAIVNALNSVGVDMSGHLKQLRSEEHSICEEPMDLLDFYYCSSALPSQEKKGAVRRRDVGEPGKYLREAKYYTAYWRQSRFVFVSGGGCAVQLGITCRARNAATGETNLELELNGHLLAKIDLGQNWTSWEAAIPGDIVLDGINEIVLHWPMPEFPGNESFNTVLSDLMDLTYPEFYPVFGEIHSFTVGLQVGSHGADQVEDAGAFSSCQVAVS